MGIRPHTAEPQGRYIAALKPKWWELFLTHTGEAAVWDSRRAAAGLKCLERARETVLPKWGDLSLSMWHRRKESKPQSCQQELGR